MKKSAFRVTMGLAALCFAALVVMPQEAAEGARRGLAVSGGLIIPALLPFLVISGLMNALGLQRLLGRAADKLTRRLFGLSGTAAAPLLLGLTGGYPVGAAAAAELVKRGDLSAEDASRLLPFCNNTGPAFIIGAAGSGVFGSPRIGLLLYASHIFAALAVGLLFSAGVKPDTRTVQPAIFEVKSFPQALTESVKGAVAAVLNICGFAVFFSVILALLDGPGLIASLSALLSGVFGWELRFSRALLTGVLELGSGIGAMTGLAPTAGALAMCSFVLGFGSLSVHCQTLAAVSDTEIKTARHFAGRLLHGGISALFTFLVFTLLQT